MGREDPEPRSLFVTVLETCTRGKREKEKKKISFWQTISWMMNQKEKKGEGGEHDSDRACHPILRGEKRKRKGKGKKSLDRSFPVRLLPKKKG